MSTLAQAPRTTLPMLNKVPLVTLAFWVIKILATTVGETGADFLNITLGFGLVTTSLIMSLALVAVLLLQLAQRRYVPWIYWLLVVFLSVVGTLLTDNLTDNFGVSLNVSTALFAAALAATFWLWNHREHTLSIHAIDTPSRERFYWLAILFTFALGTAAGDLMSEQLGLGYWISGLIFAAGIALVTVAYFGRIIGSVPAFWIAYVLTRPLGASIGDWLTQLPSHGGLGLATMTVSAIFLVVIVALVAYLTVSGADQIKRERTA